MNTGDDFACRAALNRVITDFFREIEKIRHTDAELHAIGFAIERAIIRTIEINGTMHNLYALDKLERIVPACE